MYQVYLSEAALPKCPWTWHWTAVLSNTSNYLNMKDILKYPCPLASQNYFYLKSKHSKFEQMSKCPWAWRPSGVNEKRELSHFQPRAFWLISTLAVLKSSTDLGWKSIYQGLLVVCWSSVEFSSRWFTCRCIFSLCVSQNSNCPVLLIDSFHFMDRLLFFEPELLSSERQKD